MVYVCVHRGERACAMSTYVYTVFLRKTKFMRNEISIEIWLVINFGAHSFWHSERHISASQSIDLRVVMQALLEYLCSRSSHVRTDLLKSASCKSPAKMNLQIDVRSLDRWTETQPDSPLRPSRAVRRRSPVVVVVVFVLRSSCLIDGPRSLSSLGKY
uniref:Uncharacterized protein n=1 Tax=Oryza sativa subsp. japonica TaxID=39947 RepID=Q6YY30_ORYSJ|nr:hypothetical protein [Oryza sativa Japonica Group]